MKKCFFLCMLFFLSPCLVCAKDVVALGDSITTGYGVEENESYVSLFCQGLKKEMKEEVHCTNLAVNGLTSSGLIDLLQLEETRKQIKTSDYVLMSIGGNDFLKELTSNLSTYLTVQESYPQVTVIGNTLIKNLSTILDEITRINPHVKIFLVPLYNPYKVLLKRNLVLVDSFNATKKNYINTAVDYPQVIIKEELSNTLERKEYLNVSTKERNIDPHPNRLGHDAIAKVMIEEIKVSKPVDVQTSFPIFYFFIFGIIALLLVGIGIFLKQQDGK